MATASLQLDINLLDRSIFAIVNDIKNKHKRADVDSIHREIVRNPNFKDINKEALEERINILLIEEKLANKINRNLNSYSVNFVYDSVYDSNLTSTTPVNDTTVLVPNTQDDIPETPEVSVVEKTMIINESEIITPTKDIATSTLNEKIDVSVLEKKFDILSRNIETRLHKIEDKMIGMQLSNPPGIRETSEASISDNFCIEILKNRVLELEKQLSEKNNIIDFLTAQLMVKSSVTSNNISHCDKDKGKSDVSPVSSIEKNDTSIEKNGDAVQSHKVVIVGDSMLNNINSRGLCKSKKVEVLNCPGATSADILTKIDDV